MAPTTTSPVTGNRQEATSPPDLLTSQWTNPIALPQTRDPQNDRNRLQTAHSACPAPAEPDGSYITEYLVNTTTQIVVQYKCEDRHELLYGNLTRSCNASGIWEGVQPVCDPWGADFIAAEIVGAIIGALGLILLIILPLDFIRYRRKKARIRLVMHRKQHQAITGRPTAFQVRGVNTRQSLEDSHRQAVLHHPLVALGMRNLGQVPASDKPVLPPIQTHTMQYASIKKSNLATHLPPLTPRKDRHLQHHHTISDPTDIATVHNTMHNMGIAHPHTAHHKQQLSKGAKGRGKKKRKYLRNKIDAVTADGGGNSSKSNKLIITADSLSADIDMSDEPIPADAPFSSLITDPADFNNDHIYFDNQGFNVTDPYPHSSSSNGYHTSSYKSNDSGAADEGHLHLYHHRYQTYNSPRREQHSPHTERSSFQMEQHSPHTEQHAPRAKHQMHRLHHKNHHTRRTNHDTTKPSTYTDYTPGVSRAYEASDSDEGHHTHVPDDTASYPVGDDHVGRYDVGFLPESPPHSPSRKGNGIDYSDVYY